MIVEIKQLYVYPVKDPGSYPIYAHEQAAFKLLNGCIGTNIIKGPELEGCLYNIFKEITSHHLNSVSGFTRMNYFEIERTRNYIV
jgi:hypothetical protein